jgi:hypothetical protein
LVAVLVAGGACATSPHKIDRTFGKKQKDEQPEVTRQEVWYLVRMMGTPVGSAHEISEMGPAGSRSAFGVDLEMMRMGQGLSMKMAGDWYDGPDGRLVSASYTIKASSMSVATTASMEGDNIKYVSGVAGYEQTKWIPWEEGAIGTAAASALIEEKLKAGETDFEFRTFGVEEGKFKTVRVVRVDAEPMEIDGRMQMPIVVESYEDGDDAPTSTTWMDEDYVGFKTVMLEMGIEIVFERIPPEDVESIELESSFDLIEGTMISCDGFPDPAGVSSVTLRVSFKSLPSDEHDFTGPNQTFQGRGDDAVDLTLTSETASRMTMTKSQLRGERFLQPNRYIQSDHPRIKITAESVRQETGADGWELARELAFWVNGYIKDKNYGQGYASALEVLDKPAGDCTEHSMLLTALLRAAGIPARPAIGLVYMDGNFAGHMWTEAYVGYWRTLDALDPRTLPIRIRLSAPEPDSGPDDMDFIKDFAMIGGIGVEVLDYKAAGE